VQILLTSKTNSDSGRAENGHPFIVMNPRLSVIIPVRNDAASLTRTLDHLVGLGGISEAEIIVAASGGEEGTKRAVADRARLLWPVDSTRAALLNAGATVARGQVLFFLHADSFPPPNAFELIHRSLSDDRVVGGAFEHLFMERRWSLVMITLLNRIRYRFTRNYYGDQGIFVRTPVFHQLGGYKDLQLMEDLDFSQRMKRMGRTILVRAPLLTSGRRFLARGPWRTFFFVLWLLLLYTLRFDTQRYSKRWRGPINRPPGSPWVRGRLRARAEQPKEQESRV